MLPIRLNAPRGAETPALALLMAILTLVFFTQMALDLSRGTDLVAAASLAPWLMTSGDGAFIGSDTMLVAPVTVGDGAATGAGAVVIRDIPEARRAVGVPARLLPPPEEEQG